MFAGSLHEAYRNLDAASRHVIQILALSDEAVALDRIVSLSSEVGWKKRSGASLSRLAVRRILEDLERQDLVVRSDYPYGFLANEDVEDIAVQDSIRRDWFASLRRAVDTHRSERRYSYRPERLARRLRVAFYTGQVSEFQAILKSARKQEDVRLLDPFSRDIYDRLDPVLREMYLVDVIPQFIIDPVGGKEALAAFDELVEGLAAPGDELAGCWLDVAVARADFASLRKLDERTRHRLPEIEGCEALLRGDWERAEQRLAEAFGSPSQKGKRKGRVADKHLPALLYLLLLFKRGSDEALAHARLIASTALKRNASSYGQVMDIVVAAIDFQQSHSSPVAFAGRLNELHTSPLATLLAGYFQRWLLADEETKRRLGDIVTVADAYRSTGLAWLAAEAAGLAGTTTLKNAAARAEMHRETHARLGSTSLVDLIEPEPMWRRALSAIARLGEVQPPGTAAASSAPHHERLVWELREAGDLIDLQPFVQKRTASGWTAGRRVSLQRLLAEFNTPEFAFLTDQDRALCRTIEAHAEVNYYGYRETSVEFNDLMAARALVGHPSVFREGDRDTPLEIVEQPPQLIVAKQSEKIIRIRLQPEPSSDDDGEVWPLRILQDGPRRIVFVFFSDQHIRLQRILGTMLDVPAAAAEHVLASIQRVSSLVAVHSEIGGDLPAAESVAGDVRPHLHLLPFQGGLRAEVFVRPFRDEGPFCRPGQGAADVFANVGGQPKTARRDLAEELRQWEAVLAACPALAAQTEDRTAAFPSPVEALEAMLQLEDQVAADRVVLHWPQGQRFCLAGRASASQFQVRIRKDRDWFAASGALEVDPSLSLDMLKLIELVEASPSRFVQLDDGRFLALTEQLRQRIKELAAYGDRRESKLRFPPVRAAALEDLGDGVSLTADAAWTACVQRMRRAGEVRPVVPTTLQTELRDYQREAFQWLVHLAAWGVGGCLADDMGLGKTIEALALLLHRSAGGPALVVAPTSVGFNWLNEVSRFAPTLNARLFGPGDRDACFQDLGPRDVVIGSYGMLHSEAARFQAQTWHTVILDEAQAIKNMTTRRSQAAMGLTADFRLIMTGTPLENHLGELWNLFQFINPGLLGSLEHFQQRFAGPIERDGCAETRRWLKKLIRPFLLRRTKTQVLAELPPRTELTLQVELSDEEAAFYDALRRRALEKLAESPDDRPKHLMILAEIMRLRRACCHPK
ncbi:MAG: hypothetical protein FJ276_10480, partial [Planctomycetes bacterium]|nr:hypothetical protein [Planctomycetota bacterium]